MFSMKPFFEESVLVVKTSSHIVLFANHRHIQAHAIVGVMSQERSQYMKMAYMYIVHIL